MKRDIAAQVNTKLNSIIDGLFEIPELVRHEAPEEHLAYVSMLTPVIAQVFVMSSTISREYPGLEEAEEPVIEPPPHEEPPSDESWRAANSMTRETAGKVAGAIRDQSSHLDDALRLLGNGCGLEELTTFEAARKKVKEGVEFILNRIEVQHPGLISEH
jgi:hypothetical protein